MKKLLMIFLLGIISINAGEFKITQAKKQPKTITYKEFKKKFTLKEAKKLKILDKYIKNTGADKKSAKIDFKNVYKNEDWKKAMYELYYNKKLYKVDTGKKAKSIIFPNLKKVLVLLNKVVEKTHNPIAAWQGVDLITNNYMNTGPGEIAKLYMRTFAKELADRNFCIGYLYYGRTFMKEFGGAPKYKKAYEVFKKGKEKCINKNIPWYYYHGIKSYKVKASTMLDLTKGK